MVNVTNAPAVTATPATSTLPDTLIGVQIDTTQYVYASPSGIVNDVNGGFPRFIGRVRLAVTLAAGDATWTGLGAGVDGQEVVLWNTDAANTLFLPTGNAGSQAQNQFQGSALGYALAPGYSISMIYYTGNVNGWVMR